MVFGLDAMLVPWWSYGSNEFSCMSATSDRVLSDIS